MKLVYISNDIVKIIISGLLAAILDVRHRLCQAESRLVPMNWRTNECEDSRYNFGDSSVNSEDTTYVSVYNNEFELETLFPAAILVFRVLVVRLL